MGVTLVIMLCLYALGLIPATLALTGGEEWPDWKQAVYIAVWPLSVVFGLLVIGCVFAAERRLKGTGRL